MVARPLVLPHPFSDEGSWEQWYFHFQNVAAVNDWNAENQLKWLKVRLVGRAQTAFQRLPDDTRADFKQAVAALKERFEPASRKTRYQAELQVAARGRLRAGRIWRTTSVDSQIRPTPT